VIGWDKPVYTLAHPPNATLVALGALDASLLVSEAPSAGG